MFGQFDNKNKVVVRILMTENIWTSRMLSPAVFPLLTSGLDEFVLAVLLPCRAGGDNSAGSVSAVTACHGHPEGVRVLQLHLVLFRHGDERTPAERMAEA